jgi:uncharacterized membrane protein YjfL (UPF0719 family)
MTKETPAFVKAGVLLARESAKKEDSMTESVEKPGVVKFLQVVAWIVIAIALMFAVDAGINNHPEVVTGSLAGAIAGVLILALCVAVEKLNEIEHHLRAK